MIARHTNGGGGDGGAGGGNGGNGGARLKHGRLGITSLSQVQFVHPEPDGEIGSVPQVCVEFAHVFFCCFCHTAIQSEQQVALAPEIRATRSRVKRSIYTYICL